MVYQIDPLQDLRWAELVASSPRSSVFHSVPWLEALRRTYGYKLVAYTTSPPGESLNDGLLFCRIASRITGRRLVSLPFSDHCEPLLNGASDEPSLFSALEEVLRREKLRHIELRPLRPLAVSPEVWRPAPSYASHEIDLRPDLATVFAKFHKSSTQRKIKRAEREGLTCESGRSPALLEAFWRLFLMTRRRHRVPPQPKAWFHNLIECFGERLQIRVAFKGRQPVAAILTLRHKDTLVYKYGCSDSRFNALGGTHLLFWRAIQEAKAEGLLVFDLGRSDWDNPGLITFKDRWGAARSDLIYNRFSLSPPSATLPSGTTKWAERIAKRAVSHLPDRILCMLGNALYKHIA